MGLKVVKSTPVVPISQLVQEYDSLRANKKTIEDRMTYLSNAIKEYAEKNGTKDDKGSFYTSVDGFLVGKQCKKSVSFNKDVAIKFFEDKHLHDAIVITKSIDEKAVEKYINNGDISYDDLESITTTKVTYAVDLKKEEEMPVVEQKDIKAVASKKPTTKLSRK